MSDEQQAAAAGTPEVEQAQPAEKPVGESTIGTSNIFEKPSAADAPVEPSSSADEVDAGEDTEEPAEDEAPAKTIERPRVCEGCGGVFEDHEVVMGKCQPCNTDAHSKHRNAITDFFQRIGL